jgi:hypothetical protein
MPSALLDKLELRQDITVLGDLQDPMGGRSPVTIRTTKAKAEAYQVRQVLKAMSYVFSEQVEASKA